MTRRTWTRQAVIDAILERQRRGLSFRFVHQTDKALYNAAKRYCGTWKGALEAAGLSTELRKWNPPLVIRNLQCWHKQGLPLRQATVDKAFYNAACRYFGNWRRALQAAGLPIPPPRWTKQRVVRAIRDRKRQGLPMERVSRDDPSLFSAGSRHFGNWSTALRAAGLSAKCIRRWSKDTVINEIRSRYAQYSADSLIVKTTHASSDLANQRDAWRQHWICLSHIWRNDQSFYAAARRLFGSWPNAVQAAGLVPRIRHRWTPASVLKAVKARYHAGLPMVRVSDDADSLYQAARAYFGGFHNAMTAAGIEVTFRKRWPRQRIIAAIQAHYQKGSLCKVWRDDKRLFWAGTLRFGNWRNALEAAGLKPKRYQRWSRQFILQRLRVWHRRSQYNISIIDRALAAAAVRLFGGLRRAWEAAAIKPRDHRWTEQRIIEAIQNRHIHGLPMSGKQFGNPSAVQAARREFGSWPNALAAAGIPAVRKELCRR